MTEDALTVPQGSYLTPSLNHARVGDAMRAGILSCPPDTSMEAVARIMATNHVHAVVVTGLGGGAPWGVVTDRGLLAVAGDAANRLAGSCAATGVPIVHPDEPLAGAVDLMARQGLSHLLVGEGDPARPIGVLSSLDVAGIVAWGRG